VSRFAAGWFVVVLAAYALLSPARAWAWGEEGHRVVARIAEAHLGRKARDGVRDLLGTGSISDYRVALWADEIKRSAFYKRRYPNNQKWHYIDLDVSADLASLDLDRACPHEDCIWKKLPWAVGVLRDREGPSERRREALFFVVHLVGDLHQPLHCANRDGDQGGNLVRVKSPSDEGGDAPATNLHRVWDIDLVRKAMGGLTWAEFADRLDARIDRDQQRAWAQGDVKAWLLESHKAAREHAYPGVPRRDPGAEPFTLPEKYLEDNSEVVKGRLQRAGIRLAKVLNEAFE
jgi:hypothetical protein